MLAYLGDAGRCGAALALGSPVVSGRVADGGIALEVGGVESMTLECGIVVNSAGFNAQAVARSIAGIRPKIHGPGQPAPDFLIQGEDAHGVAGLVNLFGIESPGLTSSLAIADHVATMLSVR